MTPAKKYPQPPRRTSAWFVIAVRASALLCLVAAGFAARQASADSGRLLVEVANGALQTRGVYDGPAPGASPRSFVNVVRAQWRNNFPEPTAGLEPFANSLLPDFVVPANSPLQGHELTLTLLGAQKWVNPPELPPPGHIPLLQPLAAGETIHVETVNGDVASDALGSLLLSVAVPVRGIDDLLLRYATNRLPSDEIDVLTFQLSARPADPSKPDLIADSGPIFVILAPDGANAAERLYPAAVFLEASVAQPVPEPNSCLLAALSGAALLGLRSAANRPAPQM
jgi:hypothetical protein